MKKLLFLVLLNFIAADIAAQETNAFEQQTLSFDLGTLRNRYIYPTTNLNYTSPLLQKFPVRFSLRLRSYGTWLIFSRSAYDATPLAEYIFSRNAQRLNFGAGIGLDARLRFVNDERSDAASSAEPLISLAAYGNFNRFSFKLPLWTRFYSNGIALTVLPELAWKAGKRTAVFFRWEESLLRIYNNRSQEWRNDCFLGAAYSF
jgi:hypothetical protein